MQFCFGNKTSITSSAASIRVLFLSSGQIGDAFDVQIPGWSSKDHNGGDRFLVLLDGAVGATGDDDAVGRWLRRRAGDVPRVVAFNKCEDGRDVSGADREVAARHADVGPLLVSATHGDGLPDLLDALRGFGAAANSAHDDGDAAPAVRVALVGRPNARRRARLSPGGTPRRDPARRAGVDVAAPRQPRSDQAVRRGHGRLDGAAAAARKSKSRQRRRRAKFEVDEPPDGEETSVADDVAGAKFPSVRRERAARRLPACAVASVARPTVTRTGCGATNARISPDRETQPAAHTCLELMDALLQRAYPKAFFAG